MVTDNMNEIVVLGMTREEQQAEIERLRGALTEIAQSGPVDENGNRDPYAGWSWCYDRARQALGSVLREVPMTPKEVIRQGVTEVEADWIIRQLSNAGYAIVPKEPDEYMLDIGACYEDPDGLYEGNFIYNEGDLARDVYKAMVRVAPEASDCDSPNGETQTHGN